VTGGRACTRPARRCGEQPARTTAALLARAESDWERPCQAHTRPQAGRRAALARALVTVKDHFAKGGDECLTPGGPASAPTPTSLASRVASLGLRLALVAQLAAQPSTRGALARPHPVKCAGQQLLTRDSALLSTLHLTRVMTSSPSAPRRLWRWRLRRVRPPRDEGVGPLCCHFWPPPDAHRVRQHGHVQPPSDGHAWWLTAWRCH
jgi:hypothetical protein